MKIRGIDFVTYPVSDLARATVYTVRVANGGGTVLDDSLVTSGQGVLSFTFTSGSAGTVTIASTGILATVKSMTTRVERPSMRLVGGTLLLEATVRQRCQLRLSVYTLAGCRVGEHAFAAPGDGRFSRAVRVCGRQGGPLPHGTYIVALQAGGRLLMKAAFAL